MFLFLNVFSFWFLVFRYEKSVFGSQYLIRKSKEKVTFFVSRSVSLLINLSNRYLDIDLICNV